MFPAVILSVIASGGAREPGSLVYLAPGVLLASILHLGARDGPLLRADVRPTILLTLRWLPPASLRGVDAPLSPW